MRKQFLIISAFLFSFALFSFFTGKPPTAAEKVKEAYHQKALQLEKAIIDFQQAIATNDEKKIQRHFLKMRAAYKEIETVVEYYFNAAAVALNGPPIPFFEEEESDVGQQEPRGMQVIEGFIFPKYNRSYKKELKAVAGTLLENIRSLQQTDESNAFSDAFIFDAVTEELYRITSMGITGFDSQTAVNGLPECAAALKGVADIIKVYQAEIQQSAGSKYDDIQQLIAGARTYLLGHTDFNSFNRMEFIKSFMNPVTRKIGEYKQQKMYEPNPSPLFYSTINKNKNLFDEDIFDANKYLDDNTTSPDKIVLGRKLFFEKQLSNNNKHSCASCHNPSKAFTDGLRTSMAIDGHTSLPRNAPTLWNAAIQRNYFLDNRGLSLEDQVMQVLSNKNEMHGSAQDAAEKILKQTSYMDLYEKAYPGANHDNAAQNICNAIACYERTLMGLNSRFDKYMRNEGLMNNAEINGFNLFMGKAKCGTCHFTPLFSGSKPPRFYYVESEVIGVPDKKSKVHPKLDEDQGRFAISGLPLHKFSFKTVTLRNIALTAPYMHNGVFNTLEEVVDFYNNGGGKGLGISPANQTLPFDKLNLGKTEQKNIVLFLKTLTDTTSGKIQ